MLVDDDSAAHIFHKIMIKEAGLSDLAVEEYFTVDDALKSIRVLVENDKCWAIPQVILVDLSLPPKTGWDFINGIKQFNLNTFFSQDLLSY